MTVGSDRANGAATGAPGVRAAGARAAVTAIGAAVAAGVALALAACARALLVRGGPAQVDVVVEVAVVGLGALVAAWLALSATLAAACLVARVAGASWRTGERAVHRFAPAIVRRALVVVVTAGLGAGLAPSAHAADGTPAPAVAAGAAADASGLDLGWVVTATAPVVVTSDAGAPTAGPRDASAPVATGPADARMPVATGPAGVSTTTDAPIHEATGRAAGSSAVRRDEAPASTASTSQSGDRTGTTVHESAARTAAAAGSPASVAVDAGGVALTDGTPAVDPRRTPAAGATPGTGPHAVRRATAGETVVVRRGDSLWRIAARHLPAGSDVATIAAAWPAWYAANRDTIGDDPGLLLPGQVLVVPDGATR